LLVSAAIAGIVLLSSALVHPVPAVLLPGGVALGMLALAVGYPWRRAAALAWRLKWFHLSLLFFFGWLHPSQAGAERLIPSLDGLADASLRICALLLVVGWVVWLTSAFDRDALVLGLARWLAPLRPLGVRGDVFALRLFLALEQFEANRGRYRGFRDRCEGGRWNRLKAAREFLTGGLERALSGAGHGAADSPLEGDISGVGPVRKPRGLPVQVMLLWVAVLVSGWIRWVGPGAAGL
jgi:hypothetical protein